MILSSVRIRNFRGIEDLYLPLGQFTVLIGENNVGKSSVLDAIRICLTGSSRSQSRKFDPYDYYLGSALADPSQAKPIEITLEFAESEEAQWSDEISQLLSPVEQIDSDQHRSVRLRVTSVYRTEIDRYETTHEFLDLSGNALPAPSQRQSYSRLQQLAPVFSLSTLRDVTREFRANSTFWGPFVRGLKVDEQAKSEIEHALKKLNEEVLKGHTDFKEVQRFLNKIAKLVPVGGSEPVSIEAVPSRVFDLLSRVQVHLESRAGARIPLARHGQGTQSLTVIFLFDAFLSSQLSKQYGGAAGPVLVMEEPDAHLHPAAVEAIGKTISELDGQKIVTTHSGDLLAATPLTSVRRLTRKNGKITADWIREGKLEKSDAQKLDYLVRRTRGNLLFARCWLVVEGESEAQLLPECARAMGYHLYTEGIACLHFTHVGLDRVLRIANMLGIEWFVLADGDADGSQYTKTARGQLNGREALGHIKQLNQANLELLLCEEGFGSVYKANLPEQNKNNITADAGTQEYWEQVCKNQRRSSKIQNVLAVAEKMDSASNVPPSLREVIVNVRKLAENEG